MAKTDHIYMPDDHMDKLYNSGNPLVSYIHRKRLEIITNKINRNGHQKILDAGCGEGHLIARMHSRNQSNEYYGIDITEIALKKARQRCSYATIRKMDLSELGFKNDSFDIITCTEVIEHIYEYTEVFKEFRRVLKDNGRLILTFPNENMWTLSRALLMRRPIKVPDHVNSFSPKKIRKSIGLKTASQYNIPFNLPFFISLGSVMEFRKN
ncbi:TPA: class I SAM-dependent methyltransferase [Candidatus Woesearchaeota archaeon]|nr:Methyltransferase type 11 [archaeon GW2011_AR15]MBS3103823.1 class I SAM-dependent methyltransferase [Candidatus Woesearchaeota archaeon]HIH41887.1 class I SAM-dependent methyltransferase [Candidatus Woesearchaeota archaeon]